MFQLISRSFNVVAAMSVLVLPTMARAAEVQAKSDGVQVLDKPANQGAVVSTMKKGDVLPAADERKGMFYEVTVAGGKKGYVLFTKVQRNESNTSSLATAIRDAAQKNRKDNAVTDQSRTRSAVMGVRGLDESEELASAGGIRPDLRLVYRMEDRDSSGRDLASLETDIAREVELRMKRRGI